jgi:hypothetical protein
VKVAHGGHQVNVALPVKRRPKIRNRLDYPHVLPESERMHGIIRKLACLDLSDVLPYRATDT